MNKSQEQAFKPLFEAILKLESVEDCNLFFEDLCTIREMKDMTDRLEVAKLLLAGDTYESISEKTKVSSATISRINRCIQYGNGGYEEVISRIKR